MGDAGAGNLIWWVVWVAVPVLVLVVTLLVVVSVVRRGGRRDHGVRRVGPRKR